MFKSKVPGIFGKHITCFVHYALSVRPTAQNNNFFFVKLNFNFTLFMKFNLENGISYLCPNVAGFKKMFLNDRSENRKIKGRAF